MQDHMSGRSRGFGFVTFEEDAAAGRVFASGAMHVLGGKEVEVKAATPKGTGPAARAGGGGAGDGGGGGGGGGGRRASAEYAVARLVGEGHGYGGAPLPGAYAYGGVPLGALYGYGRPGGDGVAPGVPGGGGGLGGLPYPPQYGAPLQYAPQLLGQLPPGMAYAHAPAYYGGGGGGPGGGPGSAYAYSGGYEEHAGMYAQQQLDPRGGGGGGGGGGGPRGPRASAQPILFVRAAPPGGAGAHPRHPLSHSPSSPYQPRPRSRAAAAPPARAKVDSASSLDRVAGGGGAKGGEEGGGEGEEAGCAGGGAGAAGRRRVEAAAVGAAAEAELEMRDLRLE
jgi:hypothetical protein